MKNTKYPFWVVRSHGGQEYVKASMAPHTYTQPTTAWTSLMSEAAHFGKDMAAKVAAYHAGKIIKIVGAKPKPAPVVQRHVHLALCLDNSSSMAENNLAPQAKAAFDGILSAIRDEAAQSKVDTLASVWTFGGGTQNYSFRGVNVGGGPLSDGVKELLFAWDIASAPLISYHPYGNTPLLDAVGNAIARLKSHTHPPNTSMLVQVVTDGEENASNKYTSRDIVAMIDSCQKEGNWTFVFHLPPGKKAAFVKNFGVPDGNCREWERTSVGIQGMKTAAVAGSRRYYSGVSRGRAATVGYFTADLSHVKPATVRKNMVDVSGALKAHQVPREMAIKDFVEEVAQQPYRLGDAFYALTKQERIQPDKKILVKEKGKTAVYYGDEARELLGFPPAAAHSDLKIQPGNMANFDVFIQSTSTNRKLVRGTTVMVLKAGATL